MGVIGYDYSALFTLAWPTSHSENLSVQVRSLQFPCKLYPYIMLDSVK